MGDYRQLVAGFNLKRDTPPDVCAVLSFMFASTMGEGDPEPLPDHPLFGDTRWRSMFRGVSYFHGLTTGGVSRESSSGQYEVSIRCSFQCYHDEIDLLFDWLSPYMKTEGFIGYERAETADKPTLLYTGDGGKLYKKQLKEHLNLLCPSCRKKGLWLDAEDNVIRCDECGAGEKELNDIIYKRLGRAGGGGFGGS